MSRTSRRRKREQRELSGKFDADYQRSRQKASQKLTPEQEAEVVQKGIELSEILNAEKQKTTPVSIQSSTTDDPNALQQGGYLWWTGGTLDRYIPVAEYGTRKRQLDLQTFAVTAPLLMTAMSIVIKKAQGLQWSIEGGRNLVSKWQNQLLNVSNGRGWDFFFARLIRSYLESDNGGTGEIIRLAPSWAVGDDNQLTKRGIDAIERGADASWPIADLRVFDPAQIIPTRSDEFPLLYNNPSTGRQHKLRDYNFVRILDMPDVNWRYENSGLCACSRALVAAQEDRMISRFVMEKLSENPGSGIMFVNADIKRLDTALKAADDERAARGVVFYKGVIFIPILNKDGSFGVEFVDFAGLPDGFSRQEYYNILKERVASAFGLDVLEFGSIPGNNLGSGAQATVAAAQSRGKVLSVIISCIEREFRYKVLPASLNFSFENQEPAERREEAEIQKVLFENATMYLNIAGATLANQYLVDMKAVPQEYLMGVDITGNVTLDDSEAPEQKWFGERVKAYSNGKVYRVACKHDHGHSHAQKQIERLSPLPGPPLPELNPEITEEDIDMANAAFDRAFPELAGLLEARPVNV